MADTGDEHRSPGKVQWIARGDLRSECMKCGGYGRERRTHFERHAQYGDTPIPITRDIGPCNPCSGSGRVYPRKLPG